MGKTRLDRLRFHRIYAVVTVGLIISFAGCGGESAGSKVKTIPLTGRVLQVNGKPLNGGMVDMRDVNVPTNAATGVIGEDGEFKLATIVGNDRVEGIPPGEYQVVIMLDTTSQETPPAILKKKYTVKEGDTELILQLE